MVSNKVIVILIILSLLLLVFSLTINIGVSNNEINDEHAISNGSPEASIGLIINPPANSGAAVG